MENATKALIIAASVLIVIVLIAIGIKLLGSSQRTTSQVDELSGSMAVAAFNSQFTDYVGTQTGAQVKNLLAKAAATHRTGSSHKVVVEVHGGDGLPLGTYSNANRIGIVMYSLKLNSTYVVGVRYDNHGYVNVIKILR